MSLPKCRYCSERISKYISVEYDGMCRDCWVEDCKAYDERAARGMTV